MGSSFQIKRSLFRVCINDIRLFETIECRSCSTSIGPHVFKIKPITNIEFWQHFLSSDTVHGITRGAPDTACKVRLALSEGRRSIKVVCALTCQDTRDWGDVVEENAVEAAIHAVVNVVY